MKIIVVGCGRVGAELAAHLDAQKHRVVVVDKNPKSFLNLPEEFSGRTVQGEALNQDVMRRAGIEQAEGLAVVTTFDSLNLAVAHMARKKFNMSNVVARNYSPLFRSLYEAFDIQVVSSSSWGAQRIEELLYHQELRAVFSAGNGEVEVYEFTVPPAWDGRSLDELIGGQEVIPTALTRAGRAILPERDIRLRTGDTLLLSATFDGIGKIRRRLDRPGEG